ncbi:MAG: hypothetical protein K2X86_01820 [Cytophagaceae bacterium]|nr:hypothetical protein [Cytophagaceae bacterium]
MKAIVLSAFIFLINTGYTLCQMLPEYNYNNQKPGLLLPELIVKYENVLPLEYQHPFNTNFTKRNKIKRVTIKEYKAYSNKLSVIKEEEKLEKIDSKYVFEFDSTGGNIMRFYNIMYEISKDTFADIKYVHMPEKMEDVYLFITYPLIGSKPEDNEKVSLVYMKGKDNKPVQRLEYVNGIPTSVKIEYEWTADGMLKTAKKTEKGKTTIHEAYFYNAPTQESLDSLLKLKGESYLQVFMYEKGKLVNTKIALSSSISFSKNYNYSYNTQGQIIKISCIENEKDNQEYKYDEKGNLIEYTTTNTYHPQKHIFKYYSNTTAIEDHTLMEGTVIKMKWKYTYNFYKQ